MLTLVQVDMHKLADQIEGWDTPLGRTVCEARMAGSVADAVELARLGGYRKIADLNTNDPDVAYMATQTMRQHWAVNNPHVTHLYVDSRIASMSSGDVLILTTPGAVTLAYLCTHDGWALMSEETVKQFVANMEAAA